MNLSDVLFLDIYRSMRTDWAAGIPARIECLRFLLPHTTFSPVFAGRMKVHTQRLVSRWKTRRENFDPRHLVRDYELGYDALMDSPWFVRSYYDANSVLMRGDEEFERRFPAFFAHDYDRNFMLPWDEGRPPDYAAADAHPAEVVALTQANVLAFLKLRGVYRVYSMGVADEGLITSARNMLAKKMEGTPYRIVSESNERERDYMVYTIRWETPENVYRKIEKFAKGGIV